MAAVNPSAPSQPQTSPLDKAKSIFCRIFEYPSPLVLTLQACLILLFTSWSSWFLFFISAALAVFYFVLRVIEVVKDPEGKPLPIPNTVCITGASAGIGQALAVKYASLGSKTIYVTARAVKNLDETVKLCRQANPNVNVEALALDVTDRELMKTTLQQIDAKTPVDVLIANAGISPEQQSHLKQEDIVRNTYRTNIDGVVNTVFGLYDNFVSRKSGHIVLVSSVASFGSIAHPAYSSSKALVTVLGQGLRRDLAVDNVNVTVVCPGYILTNMTSQRDSQRRAASTGFIAQIKNALGLGGLPFIRPVEDLADVVVRGVQYNLDVIVFPFRLGLFAWILRFMPFTLQDKIATKMANMVYRGTGAPSTVSTSGQTSKTE